MNILLGVYACEPNKGSEPEVGWQMVNKIANLLPNDNIYAITKKNNKEVIEKEGYPSNVTFFYYEPFKWLTFWKKGGRGIRTYYYIWSYGAALFLKKKNINFDIIHHITFVNDWLPSFYYKIKSQNSKFIWGPIGSHDPISTKFLNNKKKIFTEKIRIGLQLFFRNFDPYFSICKSKSDCIIGINQKVTNKLNLSSNKKFIAEPAIGIENKELQKEYKINKDKNSFNIITIGRLIYIKNFRLTILSFAKFIKKYRDKNIKLQIVGEGADRKEFENLVKNLNIEEHVDFTGNISLQEVQNKFSQSNLFFFPTLENAGFVTIEAMANSLPVLAMQYGGPEQFVISNRLEQLIDDNLTYEELTSEFANKIEYFYQNKQHFQIHLFFFQN